jgi:phytol kinase
VQNAIIPILVLAAHAWSRSAAPCNARFPDLDVVAALALISFGWLALGTATGLNAVAFYGITAMGMVMGLSAIALARHGPCCPGRLSGDRCDGDRRVLRGGGHAQPRADELERPMWGLVLATAGLAAMAPTVLPRVFASDRVMKIAALALALPLGTYLFALGTGS